MPPSQPQGGNQGVASQGGLRPLVRTMPGDLQKLSGGATISTGSVSGSGKVMWPSESAPTPPAERPGFLSSLLQSKNHPETPQPPTPQALKLPVHSDEGKVTPLGRTPASPRSALPIPQRPVVMSQPPKVELKKPTPAVPPPTIVHKAISSTPPPVISLAPTMPPKPQPPTQGSIFAPAPSSATPPPPVMKSVQPKEMPSISPQTKPASFLEKPQTPIQPPRPMVPPPMPRIIQPSSTTKTSSSQLKDEDIGIDLGISEYLRGGPTFQINATGNTPIAPRQVATPVQPQRPLPSQANINSLQPKPIEPFVQPEPVQQIGAQHVSPKPLQANADLDAEKQRLIGERAQIAGARSAIDESLKSLNVEKQNIDNQMKPLALREAQLANDIDDLERKEQGLTGEVRRTIERDRWVKVEERRKVEQERILQKKRLVAVEGEMNGKEEEALSLVKREKDIDARVVWIDAEYKRREVRLKLAAVNQEKTTIESQRNILDNSIKRLKTALDEAEKNERRLGELKRSLAVKMPLTVAEEEKLAGERFDIEKQMHDIELRRWNIEDEYKTASELFSKQDMAYLDVTHRVEVLESELKSFGM